MVLIENTAHKRMPYLKRSLEVSRGLRYGRWKGDTVFP